MERDADLNMAQLMPLPLTVSCSSKIQIGFTFLVQAYPGCPGRGRLNGCSSSSSIQCRACLDQLLIWSRSDRCCDHVRSKERLIAINRPIATPLGGTTVFWVSSVAAAAWWPITNTAWEKWEGGEWVSQLKQLHTLCCVDRPPLIYIFIRQMAAYN